jgi:hypothetical protein
LILRLCPDRYWDEIADLGFDGVWLMGVWQRSPAGIVIALANEGLRASFSEALPDWQTATWWARLTAYAPMLSMIILVARRAWPLRARH